MEEKLNLHQALNAFYKVTRYGKHLDGEYRLNGLTALSDFDGYTVVLHDNKVTLRVYFHNQYDLDYPNKHALEEFLDRLKAVETTQYE